MGDLTLEQQKSVSIATARLRLNQSDPAQNDPGVPSLEDPAEYTDVDEWGRIENSETAKILAAYYKGLGGVAEAGTTLATGAVASIGAGFEGAIRMLFGADPDVTADRLKATVEKYTYDPRTKKGKELVANVAVPLMKIEETADDISEYVSDGNPYAATIIKTTLLGGVQLAIPAKGAAQTTVVNLKLARQRKEMKEITDFHGIRLTDESMPSDIVALANRMTPEERAGNMLQLQEALRRAESIAKRNKNAAYERAKATETWVESRAVRDIASSAERKLRERGYVLTDENMGPVIKTLDDMRGGDVELGFGGQSIAERLGQLEHVRQRINKRTTLRREPPDAALEIIKQEIDDFLVNEFYKITTGERGAISGDSAGIAAWLEARSLNTYWKKNFHTDRVISKFIKEETTAEQLGQWLLGANAVGASKQAGLVIERMKEVLGKDHPAIAGIKQDYLYELVAPLIEKKSRPNFVKFADNYEAMVYRNSTLIDQLGLNKGALNDLFVLAKTQSRKPIQETIGATDVTKAVARLFLGHGLAKASMRQNIGRMLLNRVVGIERYSQKEILMDMVGVKYGDPLFPKGGPLAAQFIAGAAIDEIESFKDE